jgi:hypothetical protein
MNEIRKALLQVLAQLSERYPSMRLGQIVCMAATLASEDGLTEPTDVDDLALYQGARDHYEARAMHREWTKLPSVRRHLLAGLATIGSDRPELGKWLCELAKHAHGNVYDVEDEQLLNALAKQHPAPIQ